MNLPNVTQLTSDQNWNLLCGSVLLLAHFLIFLNSLYFILFASLLLATLCSLLASSDFLAIILQHMYVLSSTYVSCVVLWVDVDISEFITISSLF